MSARSLARPRRPWRISSRARRVGRGDGRPAQSARPLVAANDRGAGARIRRRGHLSERRAAAAFPAFQPAQRTRTPQPDRTSDPSLLGTVACVSRRARVRATDRAPRRRACRHQVQGEPLRGLRGATVLVRVPGARVRRRLIRPCCVRESCTESIGRRLPRRRLPCPASVSRGHRIPLCGRASALSYRGLPAQHSAPRTGTSASGSTFRDKLSESAYAPSAGAGIASAFFNNASAMRILA
jgi:hypothetical protein